jgi:hypothetical protein
MRSGAPRLVHWAARARTVASARSVWAGCIQPRDQVEGQLRRAARQRHHAPAHIRAEPGLDRVGVLLEAGIDLAAIAARSAPARRLRLQQSNGDAALGQMQRRGKPGEAAADNGHLRLRLAGQWRAGRGRVGGRRPQRIGDHLFFIADHRCLPRVLAGVSPARQ